jgi:hypothetical protein
MSCSGTNNNFSMGLCGSQFLIYLFKTRMVGI